MNPYERIKSRSFWRPAVSQRSMFDIDELWTPKFIIKKDDKVSTFGSCFAQHIGNALEGRGYNWFIAEKTPVGMSKINSKQFGYNVFSARTGNIYTTSLLKQWVEWAIRKKMCQAKYGWQEIDIMILLGLPLNQMDLKVRMKLGCYNVML